MKRRGTPKEAMKHMDFHIAMAKTLAFNWVRTESQTRVTCPPKVDPCAYEKHMGIMT